MRTAFVVLQLVLIYVSMVKFDLQTTVGMSAMFILGQVALGVERLDKLVQISKQEVTK